MIKRIFIYFVSFLIFASLSTSALLADDHSKSEVQSLIKKVEKKLDKYNEAGLKGVGKELSQIEQYLRTSKTFLDDNDRDEAWYEIKKAEAYFVLINAKKDFFEAEKKYKSAKNK